MSELILHFVRHRLLKKKNPNLPIIGRSGVEMRGVMVSSPHPAPATWEIERLNLSHAGSGVAYPVGRWRSRP
jgi:hypothetical protein